MAHIFLAFANSTSAPLPTLTQEEEAIYTFLSTRSAKGHFALHRDNTARINTIAEYLIRFRDTLRVFHYSGHAERDALLLEDQEASAEGIADLLGQCPKLELIILNGCSTAGQVKGLQALPNQPAIIATNAPVEDLSATQFSTRFYQALCEQYSDLSNAFESGLAAAKLINAEGINAARGLLSRAGTPKETPIWDLFIPEDRQLLKNWKLPILTETIQEDITPNQYLIEGLAGKLSAL